MKEEALALLKVWEDFPGRGDEVKRWLPRMRVAAANLADAIAASDVPAVEPEVQPLPTSSVSAPAAGLQLNLLQAMSDKTVAALLEEADKESPVVSDAVITSTTSPPVTEITEEPSKQ